MFPRGTPEHHRNTGGDADPTIKNEATLRRSHRLRGQPPMRSFSASPTRRAIVNQDDATPCNNIFFCQPPPPSLEVFGGYSDEDPSEWLEEIELLARQQRWPDDVMLAYARSYMDGPAKKWAKLNSPHIFSAWSVFKKELLRDFRRADTAKFKLIMDLQNRIQLPNESTLRYAEDVPNLCNKVNPKMTMDDKLYYMKTGLNKYLSLIMMITPCSTVKDFLELARRIDQHLVDFEQRRSFRQNNRPTRPFPPRRNYNNQTDHSRGFDIPRFQKGSFANDRRPIASDSRPTFAPGRFERARPNDTGMEPVGNNYRSSAPTQTNRTPEQYPRRQTYTTPPSNRRYQRPLYQDRKICWNCSEQGHISRGIDDSRQQEPDFDVNSEDDFPTLGEASKKLTRLNGSRASGGRINLVMNLQRNKTTQIEINDYTVEALIDTGAVVSCIDEELSYKLKLKVVKDNNLNLKAADQEKYTIQMIVLEKCNPKIILGDDFLSHYKALINCRNNTLWIESPNNIDQDDTSLKYARAVEDRIIPEFSLCLVKGYCEPTTDDKEILIENLSSLTSKYGLITTRSLLKNTRFPNIWLLNPSSKPIKIHRHMKIGIISEVDRMYKTDHRAVSSIDLNFDINPDLSSEERNQVLMLLYEYKEMFAAPDDYKGRTHLVRHKIKTNSDIPIRKNPYRVSLREREIINNQIDKMLKKGIISHSSSPWASPVILVKKKDGTFRFCVDYRNLNSITVKDQYPLPRIDDCFDSLHGSRYFTSLDLCSGYWQVEVEEQDREKTAFVTPDGLYHFNVLPFGLCNGPATFERLMDNILRTHKWKICLCYLDDTILGCLRKAGLTLNLSKCRFAYEELLLLGHVVSKEGITPDPEKIASIKDFPALKTIKNVRAFLGLCSYYRRFIKEFSKIAYPLQILTRKNQPFVWGKEQESSFLTLKEKLSSPEVLTHYDPNKPIGLHTDASDQGLGAVLIHVEDNDYDAYIKKINNMIDQHPNSYGENFTKHNGKIYKNNPTPTGNPWLLVIPKTKQLELLEQMHDHPTSGHMGIKRTYSRIKDKYFWPSMFKTVEKYVSSCPECQFRKTPSQQPSGQLQPIPPASRPFERIGIDLLGRFPKSINGNRWIVVCTDYYSRHVETAALPRGTATEIADFFLKRIVLRHGAPKILISDRGSSFLSKLLTQVLKICNTIHKKTTSYHPQTNGQTERMNRTLTDMISMYIDEKHQNWDVILPFVTFAYNSSVQETTGYSPYFLIHGREPLTFLDSTFDWPEVPPKSGDFDDYISNLLTIVEESKKISMARTMARQDKSKQVYDKHRREVNFSPDDLVLIWTPIRKVGRADKLQKNYIGPFKIIRKTSPVNYEVKEVTGRGKKIVHVSRMKLYRTPDLRTSLFQGGEEKWKQTCENLNPRTPNTKLWHLAKQIDRAQPQTENTNMIKNTDGTPATNDKNAANLLDGIHGQMISNLGKNCKERLLDIFNNSWKTGKLPQDWKTEAIIPIKKLDKSADDPENYRPISLTRREWGADATTLKLTYTSLIRPILEYGYQIYGTASETNLKSLERIQLSAARIITGLRNTCPNDIVLYEADIMPLKDRRSYNLPKYINKLKILRSELIAIYEALKSIRNTNYQDIWILTDSRSAIQHLRHTGALRDKVSRNIIGYLQKPQKFTFNGYPHTLALKAMKLLCASEKRHKRTLATEK
ncbi:K02A2.6-like [Cordylochernes scorpioides]|uniref:RNA-directed DNA polymerase n=1 Tax=Cordylochernes scorpioides TaxID=51811 RepID=A0ABY6KZ19_9ARAC|nr:K02A2.6-like [Cordylochernes scorpioides]